MRRITKNANLRNDRSKKIDISNSNDIDGIIFKKKRKRTPYGGYLYKNQNIINIPFQSFQRFGEVDSSNVRKRKYGDAFEENNNDLEEESFNETREQKFQQDFQNKDFLDNIEIVQNDENVNFEMEIEDLVDSEKIVNISKKKENKEKQFSGMKYENNENNVQKNDIGIVIFEELRAVDLDSSVVNLLKN